MAQQYNHTKFNVYFPRCERNASYAFIVPETRDRVNLQFIQTLIIQLRHSSMVLVSELNPKASREKQDHY
jgi:hypothetical protein